MTYVAMFLLGGVALAITPKPYRDRVINYFDLYSPLNRKDRL